MAETRAPAYGSDAPGSQTQFSATSNSTGIDLNDEDSDDDLYEPYPPKDTRPPTGSQGRTKAQTYAGLLLTILTVMLISCSSRTPYLMKWIWILSALKVTLFPEPMLHDSGLIETVGNVPSSNSDSTPQRDPVASYHPPNL